MIFPDKDFNPGHLYYSRRNNIGAPKMRKEVLVILNCSLFQYCDSNIGLFAKLSLVIFFALILVLVLCFFSWKILLSIPTNRDIWEIEFFLYFSLSPLRARKSNNCRYCWKNDNYTGSNLEETLWTNVINRYTNLSKEIRSNNFCYRKVGKVKL